MKTEQAMEISQVKKRDGSLVNFNNEKIFSAIFKAVKAVGGKDKKEARRLADEVILGLKNKFTNDVPSVEDVQDMVEKVLIEEGHAATAKSYILYRQKRNELRKEKAIVLEKEELDEVDKNFDVNALRVLKARYLRKSEDGKLIETPKVLWTRVCTHGALPDLIYDSRVFDMKKKQKVHINEKFDIEEWENKLNVGKYKLNRFHLEAIKRMYNRANEDWKAMKVSWSEFLDMLKKNEFKNHEKTIDGFYVAMTNKRFIPNTPAIANFGASLGMGSACFHPDQPIVTEDGIKKIKEIKIGDKVLSHKGRFRKVEKVFIRDSSFLLSINCHKLPKKTMQMTEEHPILAYKNEKVNWYPAYELNKGDYVALSYPWEVEDLKEIKISDFVDRLQVDKEGKCFYEYKGGKYNAFKHSTKSLKNNLNVDYDLMKVFGFYLSEGCVLDNNCVRFTFSEKEEEYCNEIIRIFKQKFNIETKIERTNDKNKKWIALRFHSTILAEFFLNIFGTGFDKKKIPSWIIKLPKEKQKGIMEGMIKGDGTVFKNGNNLNAKLVMCNTNLVYAFWQMCMRVGIFASLGNETMPKLGNVRPVKCQISGKEGTMLIQELYQREFEASEFVDNNRVKNINGIVFTQIENIEGIPYNGKVYNLEVEEDHSYVTNMVSVHNCFVMDVEDSIEGIMETLKSAAIIFKSGGGIGYNFSKLRNEGDFVSTTCGVASGPISFATLFDKMTDVIKQGGIRRGANMGILNSNHPDIEKFITAKAGNKALKNFNISVLIMPDFWEHYKNGTPYPLRNPRTGEVVRTADARQLFDKIVYQAWESAEPGVIFYDKVNETNPFFEHLGPIVTTNPCVAADSLIATENGLERIDSISSENIVVDTRLASNNQLVQLGTKIVKPYRIMKTGIKETLKLTTKAGYEVIATADHRIMTENGWKQLKDLTADDCVYIQSGEGRFNKNKKIPFEVINEKVGKNGRTYKFNLPTEWTSELGLVLGWLTGDGFISKDKTTLGLVFSPHDDEARKIIQPLLEKYCNRKIKVIKYANGCVQLRSSSRQVIEFFIKLGFNPNEREVSTSIFTAPKESVIAFLAGLFSSDGTIGMGSKSRNYVRLNSSSIKLLKQVQILLLNLGVKSNIYDRSTKPKVFNYTAKDGSEKQYETSGVNYEINISKKNLSKFLTLVSFIQQKNINKINKLLEFEFYSEKFLEKINSVEPVGKREVWDITEPATSSFIANGIVVHNCGEVLLYPNESCNLGSVNVWAFAKQNDEGEFYYDWESLKETIYSGCRFLDNIIDVNKFPLKAIEDMTLATRKIGFGIMGLGDLLYELRIPYNSDEGRKFMEKIMQFINYYTKLASVELAKEKGPLPYFDKSFYPKGRLPITGFDDKKSWDFDWNEVVTQIKKHGIRNGYTTIIAPTGSISMIAGTSSGIEPVYSLVFEKNVKVGSFYYVDPVFERVMKEEGLYNEKLMADICDNRGSLQNISYVPEELRKVFITAMDTKPEDHIFALATFQKWVDSSISKTNNFPANATVEYMKQSYLMAYKLGCKDVTVYRDASIKDQVLVAPSKADGSKGKEEKRLAESAQLGTIKTPAKAFVQPADLSGAITERLEMTNKYSSLSVCPECGTSTAIIEGCVTCKSCGWGLCK